MRTYSGSRDAIARVRTPVPAAVSNTVVGSVKAIRWARSNAYDSKIRGAKYRSYISGMDPAKTLSVANIGQFPKRIKLLTGQRGVRHPCGFSLFTTQSGLFRYAIRVAPASQ